MSRTLHYIFATVLIFSGFTVGLAPYAYAKDQNQSDEHGVPLIELLPSMFIAHTQQPASTTPQHSTSTATTSPHTVAAPATTTPPTATPAKTAAKPTVAAAVPNTAAHAATSTATALAAASGGTPPGSLAPDAASNTAALYGSLIDPNIARAVLVVAAALALGGIVTARFALARPSAGRPRPLSRSFNSPHV